MKGKRALIEFGRFAIEQSSNTAAKSRPETFDFLGFTHQVCGKTRETGVGLRSIRHSQWLNAYACHATSDQG